MACPRRNVYKGQNLTAIDSRTEEVVPLFNPRIHAWADHFSMEEVRTVGLAPTGRATARLLNMNAEERMKVRQVLQTRGEI